MSTNDMTLESYEPLPLKSGVTIKTVLNAFKAFLTLHGVDLSHEPTETGWQSSGLTTFFWIDNSQLTFQITCSGPGGGHEPTEFDKLKPRISALLASSAIVQFTDCEWGVPSEAATQVVIPVADTPAVGLAECDRFIAMAKVRNVLLQHAQCEPSEAPSVTKSLEGVLDQLPAPGNDRYQACGSALKALLNGLYDLGFGSNAEIEGADAVQAIAELVQTVEQDYLPAAGMQPVHLHSSGEPGGYWSETGMAWGDIDCATKRIGGWRTPESDLLQEVAAP